MSCPSRVTDIPASIVTVARHVRPIWDERVHTPNILLIFLLMYFLSYCVRIGRRRVIEMSLIDHCTVNLKILRASAK